MFIYRSTDRGETWSPIWEFDGYPNRLARFTHDYSGAPWLDFGRTVQPPESNPKLGWMTQSFEIDPHNSDRFYYGTGGGIYGGTNLTDWDTGGTVDISVKAQGIEETSVQDLAAPPGNVELYSALGDIGGFAHTDISTVPDSFHYSQPHHDTVSSIDFAEDKPDTVVRAGKSISSETESWIGVSTSGGSSWFAGNKPGDVTGPGTVAISADASAIVWAPEGGPARRSTTLGSTWSDLTGLPEGAQVASDREDPKSSTPTRKGSSTTQRMQVSPLPHRLSLVFPQKEMCASVQYQVTKDTYGWLAEPPAKPTECGGQPMAV